MRASVIVVNYRSWDALAALLTRLGADRNHADPLDPGLQVIVVDNRSDDGRLNGFRQRWNAVEWIEAPINGGFAYGCNLGAQQAKGDKLLFLNADVEVSRQQISDLISILDQHPDVALLSCNQRGRDGSHRKVLGRFPGALGFTRTGALIRRLLRPLPRDARELSGLVQCDWVTGSALMIRRAVFDRLGGWSEDFWMYSEDLDLCRRAADLGYLTACTGDITISHLHGASSRIDLDTEVVTRAEVIISKHVYAARHIPPARRWVAHLTITLGRCAPLLLAPVGDLLTLFRIRRLTVARRVGGELLRYYRGCPWRRGWRGPRAQVTVEHRRQALRHHRLAMAD